MSLVPVFFITDVLCRFRYAIIEDYKFLLKPTDRWIGPILPYKATIVCLNDLANNWKKKSAYLSFAPGHGFCK